MLGQKRLSAYRELVESRLDQLLPSQASPPQKLHEAMRYSALAPGKRLRPALCMASCAAVGGRDVDALDAACSLELVHCFSLIHDDLPAIDNDDLRRGRPTCHVQFGEAIAILAGDALFALAFAILARMKAPAEAKLECLRLLSEASGSPGLVAGEVLDILSEGQPPSKELVRLIHEWKTGSLIAASCAMGAALGGGDERQIRALEAYGRHVGLAFQIADDVLNETATSEALGKAVGSDKERSKQTYPAVMGIERAKLAAEANIHAALAELDGLPGDVEPLREMALFTAQRQS